MIKSELGRMNLEVLNCLLECRDRDGVVVIIIIGFVMGSMMMNIGGDGGVVKLVVRGLRKVVREVEEVRRGVRMEEGGDDEREREREDGYE